MLGVEHSKGPGCMSGYYYVPGFGAWPKILNVREIVLLHWSEIVKGRVRL